MPSAGDILAHKHAHHPEHQGDIPVFRIRPVDSVYDAVASMAEHEIGALLVMIEDQVVGIISERDYARKMLLKDRSSHTTRVSEIMTPDVICAKPDDPLLDCLGLMSRHHIRHLPVVSEGVVMGMLSTRDLLTALVDEQANTIQALARQAAAGTAPAAVADDAASADTGKATSLD